MSSYQYQSLPSPTSIRLIKLKSRWEDADVSLTIEVADVLHPPEYCALSYLWGDPNIKVPVICNNEPILITPNLRDAFKRLGGMHDRIWADALCINQDDVAEKNHQVAMMATIYSKALYVCAWLGPDPHGDGPLVFNAFVQLVQGLAQLDIVGATVKSLELETGDLYWVDRNGAIGVAALPDWLVNPDEEDKPRLLRFFKLPYFSRVWMLQEVGLAADVGVVWGAGAMEWHAIGVCSMFLLRYAFPLIRKLGIEDDVKNVYNLYTTFSPYNPRHSFLQIIQGVRSFGATDPRDKVFALMSHPTARTLEPVTAAPANSAAFSRFRNLAIRFLPNMEDKEIVKQRRWKTPKLSPSERSDVQPVIEADYSRSVMDMYRDLVVKYIERRESLDILMAVQHDPTNIATLPSPSWVPRWDQFIGTPVMGLTTTEKFMASNKTRASFQYSPAHDPNFSVVRGVIFERIEYVSELLDSASFQLDLPEDELDDNRGVMYGPESEEVRRWWEINPITKTIATKNLVRAVTIHVMYPKVVVPVNPSRTTRYSVQKSDETGFDAYLRTWVAGKNNSPMDGYQHKPDSESYYVRLLWGNQTAPPTPRRIDPYSTEAQLHVNRYRDSVQTVCHKRKFFHTKSLFMGIGAGVAQKGDWVAVLQGSDFPFVIREVGQQSLDKDAVYPQANKFQLVGECYVHGLMEGQLGQSMMEDITLT